MHNIPKKIFLNIGEEVDVKDDIDFNELAGVSWSSHRIHKTDIEYVKKNKLTKTIVKNGKKIRNK